MNLQELREKIYMENLKIFLNYFLEDDEECNYVITNTDNEEDFKIVGKEEMMNFIHKDLKIEHVDDEFCFGIWGDETVRIEYL